MEPTLTNHQLRVLAEGILNKGVLKIDFIYRLYASDDAAKSAILSLESWGYVRVIHELPGHLAVVRAPDDAYIMAEKIKDARNKPVKYKTPAN